MHFNVGVEVDSNRNLWSFGWICSLAEDCTLHIASKVHRIYRCHLLGVSESGLMIVGVGLLRHATSRVHTEYGLPGL